jgi:hypothetical protein
MPHLCQKMGDSMFTMKVLLLGQGGMPLRQQNWGTQHPQQNYHPRALGDAAFAQKNGGLNVHNESIAIWAKGDAARATNLGYSMSTTTKIIAAGRWGMPCLCQKMGDPTSTPKVLSLGQRGGHAQATKRGGLTLCNKQIFLPTGRGTI